jgi:hypothetical protein
VAGGRFDFQHRTQIPVYAGKMQLSTAATGTFKIRIAWMKHMATLIANKASVLPWDHGPELDARNAIGTAHNFVNHKKSAIRRQSTSDRVERRALLKFG